MIRHILAPNASPLTLDGTRTYLVGRDEVAVIDPGSADPAHLDALAGAVGDAAVSAVLLTHGHPDHAAGAHELAETVEAPVRRLADGSLRNGDTVPTDAGPLETVATPGHTGDHAAFHLPAHGVLFCGDLMMGGQNTTLVAPPDGRLGPYLDSLDRIRGLAPHIIYPAHGPPFEAPDAALDRYVAHRQERLDQVLAAVRDGHGDDNDALRESIYGSELDETLHSVANAAIKAYLQYLQGQGQVRRIGHGWGAQ